jgi:hypothetical protein
MSIKSSDMNRVTLAMVLFATSVQLFAQNTETEILSFTFLEQIEPTEIDEENQKVSIVLGKDADITNLIAIFTLSTGATATINDIEQQSGVTSNDYTNPVAFKVISESGNQEKVWTIEATLALVASVGDDLEEISFNVYPNPSSGIFNIDLSRQFITGMDVSIHDSNGRLIYSEWTQKGPISGDYSFDITGIDPGLYFIHLRSRDRVGIQKLLLH